MENTKWFVKKKEMPDFFLMLSAQCEITMAGAETLVDFMENPNAEKAEQIGMYEKQADAIRKKLIAGAQDVLITPFDRHDMFALSRKVDDIMDKINDIKDLMSVYKLSFLEEEKEITILAKEAIGCLKISFDKWGEANQDEFWDCLIKAKKNENAIKRKYWDIVLRLGEKEKELPFTELLFFRELSKDLNGLGNKIGKAADEIGEIKMKLI